MPDCLDRSIDDLRFFPIVLKTVLDHVLAYDASCRGQEIYFSCVVF